MMKAINLRSDLALNEKQFSDMRRKYKLIDMIEAKILGIGTFKELSIEFDINIDAIKRSYYQKEIVRKRYLVVKKED